MSLTVSTRRKIGASCSTTFWRLACTACGMHKVLEVTVSRGADKKPLVARFGGIELRWQKTATLNDRPEEVNGRRSEIEQRLLAQYCELCGAEGDCEVHHIRKLADLDKSGRKEKPAWVQRMAIRKRKTLVVCRTCHEAIHYGEQNDTSP